MTSVGSQRLLSRNGHFARSNRLGRIIATTESGKEHNTDSYVCKFQIFCQRNLDEPSSRQACAYAHCCYIGRQTMVDVANDKSFNVIVMACYQGNKGCTGSFLCKLLGRYRPASITAITRRQFVRCPHEMHIIQSLHIAGRIYIGGPTSRLLTAVGESTARQGRHDAIFQSQEGKNAIGYDFRLELGKSTAGMAVVPQPSDPTGRGWLSLQKFLLGLTSALAVRMARVAFRGIFVVVR
mmetsp:Transcript_428/g.1277  ORF Transcript_428/g.1277 Transcript_428/m.1277 type:complete len:238 (+) Transcript_428:322-1035(+)